MKCNQFRNFPIEVSEIDRNYAIYGPQVAILKVKSIRKFPGHVGNIPSVPLPLPIDKEYNKIILIVDYIFINRKPYFLTKPAKINFHSIQACTGRGKVEINKGLDIFKKTYESRGFNVTQYHVDKEFDKIRPHLLVYKLHICAADYHIGVI